jgi:methyltransferase (TIGR00027 family)
MLPGQPSQTLLRSAIRRATHQVLDRPVIFDDPIALQVVPEAAYPTVVASLAADGSPDPVLLRSLFAMRSRFAEDRLAEAVARGSRQYVMLGVGLDTFAWRQPDFARAIQLFSVDHPASLAFTQQLLRERGLSQPGNLAFVPADLEGDNVASRLRECGFDATLPSFCSMLGVMQYLTLPAIDALMTFVSSLAPGSEIVFSFALPEAELTGYDLQALKMSMRFTNGLGEPWQTRLRPRDWVAKLQSLKFREIFHLTPALAQQRYFSNRSDNLRAPGWEQLIAAIV